MIRNILLALACCLPFVAADVRGAAPSQPVCGLAAAGVRIVQTMLGGVPVLIRVPPRVSMPPIVLWHGFGPPDSEAALMSLLPLDDLPAVKVYAGLPLFGRRAPEDPGELARRQSEDLVTGVFGPVVMGAVRELPVMVDALRRAGGMEAGEGIGLFGFSAGGAAVLLALAEREVPVAAAVVLNASTGLPASVAAYERATGRTYAWTPETRALAERADAIARAAGIAAGSPGPALLVIHGGRDAMVGAGDARALHDVLAPYYAGERACRLALDIVDGMAHAPTGDDDAARVRMRAGDWFRRFLSRSGTDTGC